MFFYEDVILFSELTLEDYVETAWMCASFFQDLLWKVELELQVTEEILCLFIFDMQFGEESALQEIFNVLPLIFFNKLA